MKFATHQPIVVFPRFKVFAAQTLSKERKIIRHFPRMQVEQENFDSMINCKHHTDTIPMLWTSRVDDLLIEPLVRIGRHT